METYRQNTCYRSNTKWIKAQYNYPTFILCHNLQIREFVYDWYIAYSLLFIYLYLTEISTTMSELEFIFVYWYNEV